MTSQEAIIHIETLKTVTNDIPKYSGKAIDEAIDMAIKALEQTEPEKCGDCISRKATIKALYTEIIKRRLLDDVNDGMLDEFDTESIIKALPSVEPERKPGKWEYVQYDGNPKIGNWHCSNCRLIVNLGFEGAPYYHYCPGCGAKMEVENEMD